MKKYTKAKNELLLNAIEIRYTYRRKSDGHIYQIIYGIGCIEDVCKGGMNSFCEMVNNDLWEIIGRDLWTGLVDNKNNKIYRNDKIRYKMHEGYFLQNFVAIIKWNKEQACYKYEVINKTHSYLSQNISEMDEVKEDFLNYVEVVGNIYEPKSNNNGGNKRKASRKKAK